MSNLTNAQIDQVAGELGVSIKDASDGREMVVAVIAGRQGIALGSVNEISRMLGGASELLDERWNGDYDVYDIIRTAISYAA